MCRDIAGDANLYTLFRVDGQPIECPFGTQHGFTFSYNRGKGDCQWPESEIEPCTDTKRLVLNYQACPNVQGSELRCEFIRVGYICQKLKIQKIKKFNFWIWSYGFQKEKYMEGGGLGVFFQFLVNLTHSRILKVLDFSS